MASVLCCRNVSWSTLIWRRPNSSAPCAFLYAELEDLVASKNTFSVSTTLRFSAVEAIIASVDLPDPRMPVRMMDALGLSEVVGRRKVRGGRDEAAEGDATEGEKSAAAQAARDILREERRGASLSDETSIDPVVMAAKERFTPAAIMVAQQAAERKGLF